MGSWQNADVLSEIAQTNRLRRGGLPLGVARPSAVDSVGESIAKAQSYLFARQEPSGRWKAVNSSGPTDIARQMVVERYLERLSPHDAADGVRAILAQQLPDGGFPAYPTATESDLNASCMAYAALRAAGTDNPRAQERIDAQGGFDKARLDSKLFLSLAGVMDAKKLPRLPVTNVLIPGFNTWMAKYFSSNSVLGISMVAPLVRGLKHDSVAPSPWTHPLQALENRHVVQHLSRLQDREGDWYGVSFFTALGAACLHALGVPLADPRIEKALNRLDSHKTRGPEGLAIPPFTSEIWDTSMAVHTLVQSGVSPDDPRLQKAGHYLADKQCLEPTPREWCNASKDQPRIGGWSFEDGNNLAPDADCGGVALGALFDTNTHHDAALTAALERGMAWEMGMQNRDGGWAAWSHNHATKKPGPMAASPVGKWMGLPMIMTDPSTEGLTGRVLYTLGRMGHTVSEPAVRRAVDFIKSQRDTNGVWYERWGVNYVQGTAFVLKGLAAVGEDMSADYVRHGVDWLKQHQNGDGGWGEDVDSYKHKEVAGQGPSNPMLTGLALEALVAAGERDSDTARQAAQWLVSHQSGDGSWDDPTPKGVMDVHLKAYYRNDLFATNHALAGLAAYHAR